MLSQVVVGAGIVIVAIISSPLLADADPTMHLYIPAYIPPSALHLRLFLIDDDLQKRCGSDGSCGCSPSSPLPSWELILQISEGKGGKARGIIGMSQTWRIAECCGCPPEIFVVRRNCNRRHEGYLEGTRPKNRLIDWKLSDEDDIWDWDILLISEVIVLVFVCQSLLLLLVLHAVSCNM